MDKAIGKRKPRTVGNALSLLRKRGKFISPYPVGECACRLRKMQGENYLWEYKTHVKVDWIDGSTCSFRVRRAGRKCLGIEVQGQLSRYQDAESFVDYRARLASWTYLLLAVNGLIIALISVILMWPAVFFFIILVFDYLKTLAARNRLARDVENALTR